MRTTTWTAMAAVLLTTSPVAAFAADAATPMQIPAKTLQLPIADISPEMQAFIAKPLNPEALIGFRGGDVSVTPPGRR